MEAVWLPENILHFMREGNNISEQFPLNRFILIKG